MTDQSLPDVVLPDPRSNPAPYIAAAERAPPSPEQWRAFVRELAEAQEHQRNGGRPIEAVCGALDAVDKLLHAIPSAQIAGLHEPIARALQACTEVAAGAHSKLFEVEKQPRGGVSNHPRTALYGALAAIADILMATGMKRPEAAALVAREAAAAGFRNAHGKPVTTSNLEDWRDEIERSERGAVSDASLSQTAFHRCRGIFYERILNAQHSGKRTSTAIREVVKSLRPRFPDQ